MIKKLISTAIPTIGYDLRTNSIGVTAGADDTGVAATSSLEAIIRTVLGTLTLIAVIYFVIQMIMAGYGFISSQGDAEKIKTARNRVTNGILGLTIVVLAFGVGAFLAKVAGLDPKILFDLNSFFDTF